MREACAEMHGWTEWAEVMHLPLPAARAAGRSPFVDHHLLVAEDEELSDAKSRAGHATRVGRVALEFWSKALTHPEEGTEATGVPAENLRRTVGLQKLARLRTDAQQQRRGKAVRALI